VNKLIVKSVLILIGLNVPLFAMEKSSTQATDPFLYKIASLQQLVFSKLVAVTALECLKNNTLEPLENQLNFKFVQKRHTTIAKKIKSEKRLKKGVVKEAWISSLANANFSRSPCYASSSELNNSFGSTEVGDDFNRVVQLSILTAHNEKILSSLALFNDFSVKKALSCLKLSSESQDFLFKRTNWLNRHFFALNPEHIEDIILNQQPLLKDNKFYLSHLKQVWRCFVGEPLSCDFDECLLHTLSDKATPKGRRTLALFSLFFYYSGQDKNVAAFKMRLSSWLPASWIGQAIFLPTTFSYANAINELIESLNDDKDPPKSLVNQLKGFLQNNKHNKKKACAGFALCLKSGLFSYENLQRIGREYSFLLGGLKPKLFSHYFFNEYGFSITPPPRDFYESFPDEIKGLDYFLPFFLGTNLKELLQANRFSLLAQFLLDNFLINFENDFEAKKFLLNLITPYLPLEKIWQLLKKGLLAKKSIAHKVGKIIKRAPVGYQSQLLNFCLRKFHYIVSPADPRITLLSELLEGKSDSFLKSYALFALHPNSCVSLRTKALMLLDSNQIGMCMRNFFGNCWFSNMKEKELERWFNEILYALARKEKVAAIENFLRGPLPYQRIFKASINPLFNTNNLIKIYALTHSWNELHLYQKNFFSELEAETIEIINKAYRELVVQADGRPVPLIVEELYKWVNYIEYDLPFFVVDSCLSQ